MWSRWKQFYLAVFCCFTTLMCLTVRRAPRKIFQMIDRHAHKMSFFLWNEIFTFRRPLCNKKNEGLWSFSAPLYFYCSTWILGSTRIVIILWVKSLLNKHNFLGSIFKRFCQFHFIFVFVSSRKLDLYPDTA